MSNVLNTVFNNYLTTYTPKALTRYDTHKKSELRGVYNSIVKLNRDAPWYLPTTSREAQNYAVDLKENARELHNTIAHLGGLDENGLLSKKQAYSGDEDIISAVYVGNDNAAETVPELSIEVRSLASVQENMGLFLENTPVELSPDTYSFDVAINDMSYEFQFAINEGETNRDVQSRLARLINNSNIGLRASLIDSEGKTSMRVASEASGLPSGRDQIFTVSDDRTSKKNGAVDYFGLDFTSRPASDAHFLINGEEQSANANHFTLGGIFEVHLNGVSAKGESVPIGLKTDVESLTDNVTQLLRSYNNFLKTASSYLESQSGSGKLVQEMKGIVTNLGSSMESVGVRMSDDGTLQLDRGLLTQAARQSEDVNGTFSPLKEFSDSLLRKSYQVSLNPMDYVEKKIVAYKNPGHNFANPYTTSAYSGMMFNSYC